MDIFWRWASRHATKLPRLATTSGLLWPSTYTHLWCLDQRKPSVRIHLCTVLREIPLVPASSSFSRSSLIHLLHSGRTVAALQDERTQTTSKQLKTTWEGAEEVLPNTCDRWSSRKTEVREACARKKAVPKIRMQADSDARVPPTSISCMGRGEGGGSRYW